MLTMQRLLRIKDPKASGHGVVVMSMKEADRVGWNADGTPIIESGALYEQWGYLPSYAPWRRRVWRFWLRSTSWARRA